METKEQPKPIRLTLDFKDPDRESVVFDLDHVVYRQHWVVQDSIGDMELQAAREISLTILGARDKD